MGEQLLIGTAITVVLVLFHATGLVMLTRGLRRLLHWSGEPLSNVACVTLLALAVLMIVAIHTVEAWSWAALYLQLGEFTELPSALYFSVVTATTLGYGDVTLSDQWKLLGTFEAMSGLILFGASTAFLFEIMVRLFGFRRQEGGSGR